MFLINLLWMSILILPCFEVRDGVQSVQPTSPVFEVANGRPAGKYRVDISVNNEMA